MPNHYCTACDININERERKMCADHKLLATFTLSDIPPAEVMEQKLSATFELIEDGVLNATASVINGTSRSSVRVRK